MGKKSMMKEENLGRNPLNNNFINIQQKLENLPANSLRVKGYTHSKINVLKKVQMAESVDDILEDALKLYMDNLTEEKQNKINQLIEEDIDYKIKRNRYKKNSKK